MSYNHILYYESIGSTNAVARQMAERGEAEGCVVLAEEQTEGRGRRGRSWASPAGSNLLLSILLRPALEPDRVFILTMVLALVTVRVLKRRTGVAAWIKWPNDLFVGEKKLAGILTEFGTRGKALDYVILGMGLNVSWHPDGPEGNSSPATSLLAETGIRFSRQELLQAILEEFEGAYKKASEGDVERLFREWNERSLILGRPVIVESDSEVLYGKALQIDYDGALILEEPDGKRRRIVCGDVSLRVKKWGFPDT